MKNEVKITGVFLLVTLNSCFSSKEEGYKNEISLSEISFTNSNKTIIDTIKGCKYLNEIKMEMIIIFKMKIQQL